MTIRTVAIVGTGLIGASWAAFFLANGFDVTAFDPAPEAESHLRGFVKRAWPALGRIGLANGASIDRLTFHPALAEALAFADFVQESGPERLEFKQELYRQMDALLAPSVIIASSSSGLMMSDIQLGCDRFPERCVIAHPFNPPHVLPLVEIVGGGRTSMATIDQAQSFFEGLGKKCIRLKREIRGHVANRIAWALYRECTWLVEQGYVDVGDVDRAVSWGPGLRWGGMGPNLLYHLGGGEGGIAHFFAHLGGSLEEIWADNNVPMLTPALRQRIADGVAQEAGEASIEALSAQRDEFMISLIEQRKAMKGILAR
ncbi:3-hydroxyacyl-CoA dehydrogenase NAD-binding domain-containing protein [Sphingobium sp. H39-3-25]|uniref:3-hydroxyacyl-CoA dehydrogenase NAD-binding domain-containing protein n=1 Tax=Sphingobium arseniciresistens TaxID=3030834 RepID=UPI0023B9BF81|nr:3-hydroxyacyl-CoA dehydrogenase NAD-binding domain-containing protein [Sphingobium arseniciresistens]